MPAAAPLYERPRKTLRPLRVVLLTSAPEWRGSAVSYVNIARALQARGHLPILFATSLTVAAGFSAEDLPVEVVAANDTGIRGARELSRKLRSVAADVLLVDMPRDLRLGALASLVVPITIVNRFNCSRTVPPRDLGVRLAYQRVRLTVFLTHHQAKQATALAPFMGGPPSQVIPEGVDLRRFRPDHGSAAAFRRSLGLGDRPFLLAVGALSPEKRYDWLFQALVLLEAPAPTLVICGEGTLRAALVEQAARLSLDVRFAGFLTPDRLVGAYSAATCLVHGCAVETFGLTVIEAMACGLPVIGIAEGALPEVTGKTAILGGADDPAAFADSVRRLLHAPARRLALGNQGQARARELFDLETMGLRYGEAIERFGGGEVLPVRQGSR